MSTYEASSSPALPPARSRLALNVSRFLGWLGRRHIANRITSVLVIAALVAGIATYLAMSFSTPGDENSRLIILLLNIDFVLLLLLAGVVARRVVSLWQRRRAGRAGARLHVRLVALFGLIATIPPILMAIFATVFFHTGVESWFSDRIKTAVQESQAVARAYLFEHQQVIKIDALAMAGDLNRSLPDLSQRPEALREYVSTQARLRNLPETLIFTESGEVIARTKAAQPVSLESFPQTVMYTVTAGEVAVIAGADTEQSDRVHALLQLQALSGQRLYLYVGRPIEEGVLSHIRRTNSAVAAYQNLETNRAGMQITVTLIFIVVALLLLFVAMLLGLSFANQLARPLQELIGAAERVRGGDLKARVPVPGRDDELGGLARAFNRMTDQLQAQREDLVDINLQLDRRRRFTEAVLAGVTTGILGLDAQGVITLANESATELLEAEGSALLGSRLQDTLKPLEAARRAARRRPDRIFETQLTLTAVEGTQRKLLVRVAAERSGDEVRGYVLTFDDIGPLLDAQRKAAWGDVAQRIAHEIKNPLTPIQLAAERLNRKYRDQITQDVDVFTECTDTIVRHVAGLRRMVNEFSAFARMPKAQLVAADLRDLCREAVALQRQTQNHIRFVTALPDRPVTVRADHDLLLQALTNLIVNAVQAVQETQRSDGEVALSLHQDEAQVQLKITDNGNGIAAETLSTVMEPYVTTKPKGTGLGLAIVRKIVDEHGGTITIRNRQDGETGVLVTVTLPVEAPLSGNAVELTEARS